MKTMRLVLLLTIVAFATATFAGEQPTRKSVDIKISLQDALNNKTLASEMLMHLNPGFLAVKKAGLYYTTLRFRRNTYVIYGKYQEWKAFFNMAKWRMTKPEIGAGLLSEH
jgi:hypothetical protein